MAGLQYVRYDDTPQNLRESELKPRLSWLYYHVFSKMPIVKTTFADIVISAYSKRYFTRSSEDIVELLYYDALTSQDKFPRLLMGMDILGEYGVAFAIFRTPACFYLPELLFVDKNVSLSMYSFLIPRLKKTLLPYWEGE